MAMFVVVMRQICGRNGKRSNRTLREEVGSGPAHVCTLGPAHSEYHQPLGCAPPGAEEPAQRGQPDFPPRDDLGLRPLRLGARQRGLHLPLLHLQLAAG